jgi:hypothetical protein
MTAALAHTQPTTDPRHRVTVRPAPRREPPFDDELPQRHLTLVGPHDRPLPFAPSRRRLTDLHDAFAMQPTGRGQLPDPALFGRRLLVAILEAMAGRRSAHQLAPTSAMACSPGCSQTWTVPPVGAGLSRPLCNQCACASRPTASPSCRPSCRRDLGSGQSPPGWRGWTVAGAACGCRSASACACGRCCSGCRDCRDSDWRVTAADASPTCSQRRRRSRRYW